MSSDKGAEKYDIGENLLHAKIKEQPSVPISLHSLISAQKPETPALSEINFGFCSRAPSSSAERFQVLCSSAAPYHVALFCLGKCSHSTPGERFKRPRMSSWVVTEYVVRVYIY